MKYELTEQEAYNLMAFLDRVPLQGHAERESMNRICYKLANPLPEDKPEEAKTEEAEQPPA